MKEYSVGQILFLIADASKVIPVKVVEEVIRTTLTGRDKTYIIRLPDKKGTEVDIQNIPGKLFTSKEEVQTFMLENAKFAINQMLEKASDIIADVFNKQDLSEEKIVTETLTSEQNIIANVNVPDETEAKVQQDKKSSIITIDLGNGKFGKIKQSDLDKAGGLS